MNDNAENFVSVVWNCKSLYDCLREVDNGIFHTLRSWIFHSYSKMEYYVHRFYLYFDEVLWSDRGTRSTRSGVRLRWRQVGRALSFSVILMELTSCSLYLLSSSNTIHWILTFWRENYIPNFPKLTFNKEGRGWFLPRMWICTSMHPDRRGN